MKEIPFKSPEQRLEEAEMEIERLRKLFEQMHDIFHQVPNKDFP